MNVTYELLPKYSDFDQTSLRWTIPMTVAKKIKNNADVKRYGRQAKKENKDFITVYTEGFENGKFGNDIRRLGCTVNGEE